jgi:hypothetical protein
MPTVAVVYHVPFDKLANCSAIPRRTFYRHSNWRESLEKYKAAIEREMAIQKREPAGSLSTPPSFTDALDSIRPPSKARREVVETTSFIFEVKN